MFTALRAWLRDERGGGVIKGIGKIISAPVRGIGHALSTSGIPILSNVGNVAQGLGNAVAGKGAFLRDIGGAAESAAPIAGLIPGIGPLAGGLIGMGGGILNRGLNKTGFGEGLHYGTQGALSGLAGSKLLGGRGILGVGNLPGSLSSLIKGGIGKLGAGSLLGGLGGGGGRPTTDALGNPVDPSAIDPSSASGMVSGGGGGDTGGILGKVLSYIGKNPLEAAQLGLAGLNAVQANKLKSQQFGLMNESMGRVNKAANAQVPGFDPYNQLPKLQAMAGAAP